MKNPDPRIRVLLTVPHLAPTASPYRETMAIAKYLPSDRFQLTVCALRNQGFAQASVILGSLGVMSMVVPFRPTARTVRGVVTALLEQRSLGRQPRFHIQHSLDFTSSPFEAYCARAAGRMFVYTQRNLNEDGHVFFLKRKIAVSNGVLAISKATKDLVTALSGTTRPVATIPLGFDFDGHGVPAAPAAPIDPPVILCVGHLQRRKRVEDAIRAVALVRETIPGAQLWVVGATYDRAYAAELVALRDRLGLTDAVSFLGVRDDVLDLMGRASALLHCAESEAFGWSLLEAMATGLPVVASDGGGPAELIQHGVTGFLTEVGDVKASSAYLCDLIRRPELAAQVTQAASRSARARYTARAFAEQHALFYRTLVECPNAKGQVQFSGPVANDNGNL